MSDQYPDDRAREEQETVRPRFTDKRRIDPETGAVREPGSATDLPRPDGTPVPDAGPVPGQGAGSGEATGGQADDAPSSADGAGEGAGQVAAAETLAAERLEDLQRLQAEYVNYRKRVERDRLVARDQTVVAIAEALMGVMDDIEAARQHGELAEGPFASIAEKLETTLARFGWERYGAVGETFDPNVHEALMHSHSDEVTGPTVVQVLQPGYRVDERIVRAARVAVAEPDGTPPE